jgi:uncharacterized protein YeaO (DUF488 family)
LPEDGFRVLVMRLWPRGVGKHAVDACEPDLGPSRHLLTAFRQGRIHRETLARRYVHEMAGPQELLDRYQEVARSQTVTLLCCCEDESRWHQTLASTLDVY